MDDKSNLALIQMQIEMVKKNLSYYSNQKGFDQNYFENEVNELLERLDWLLRKEKELINKM